MLSTAKMAALSAGKILKKYFGANIGYAAKDGNSKNFVTKADIESEKLIKKIILNKFPHHNFWGEETGQTHKNSEWTWVVDPLDGTSNFVFNIPTYAVSIALMHRDKIVLGVVYFPQTDELFWSETGKGAYCNGKKIHVSNTKKLKDAVGSVEFWSKDKKHIKAGLAEFNYFARHIKKIRYISSTIFEMCRVAKGNLDFCVTDTTFIDVAATALIIKEAGGICREKKNCPLDPKKLKTPFRLFSGNKKMTVYWIKKARG